MQTMRIKREIQLCNNFGQTCRDLNNVQGMQNVDLNIDSDRLGSSLHNDAVICFILLDVESPYCNEVCTQNIPSLSIVMKSDD